MEMFVVAFFLPILGTVYSSMKGWRESRPQFVYFEDFVVEVENCLIDYVFLVICRLM